MKYRLKKDLPWMKAGTIFWFEKGILKQQGMTCLAECYEATKNYFFSDDEGLGFTENNFKEDDWIEEVKPREWWEYDDGQINNRCAYTRFSSLEEAHKFFQKTDVKLVKVREVIK